jgi:hypothetical protein
VAPPSMRPVEPSHGSSRDTNHRQHGCEAVVPSGKAGSQLLVINSTGLTPLLPPLLPPWIKRGFPSAIPASLRETTPWLLRILASCREDYWNPDLSHAEARRSPRGTHRRSLSSPACVSGNCLLLRGPVLATTAMRLFQASGANPGLSSFLGQHWAGGLNAVGVGKA